MVPLARWTTLQPRTAPTRALPAALRHLDRADAELGGGVRRSRRSGPTAPASGSGRALAMLDAVDFAVERGMLRDDTAGRRAAV